MHRFFLNPESCRGEFLTLEHGEAHHAFDVLRLRPRDQVLVLNGSGDEFRCEVIAADRHGVRVAVLKTRSIPPPNCRVTLVQAVPKGKLFESIIQKATELGVSEIVPLLSERVVVHLDKDDVTHKTQKWQAVAIEAIKQCGSAWLPRVTSPLTLQQFAAKAKDTECALVGSLQLNAKHPRECFVSCLRKYGRVPRSACIWIGPEGDFTPEELELIQACGACPITLGRLVLRTETAAIYCLSILNYEFSGRRD